MMQTSRKVINFSAVRKAGLRSKSEQKPKILFVDDEERILNSMRALLRRQYDVTTTTDGYHALELLKEEHFHLLVSDQRMPIMPGVELLREAKQVSPDTVRILLTGFSDLAAIIGSVNDGEVFRFLNKPWDNQEFVATVAEAVQVGVELQADAKRSTPTTKPAIESILEPVIEPVAKPLLERVCDPAEQHLQDTAMSHVAINDAFKDNLIVLNGDHQLQDSVKEMLPASNILAAQDYDAAIDLMMEHETGVIICNIEGDYESALAFFALLKREHPQVISVILANSGDSRAIVDLINQARVFRYMFKPLRLRLMARYLDSALKQYHQFKVKPTLLKQQKAQQLLTEKPVLVTETVNELADVLSTQSAVTPTSGSLLVRADVESTVAVSRGQSSPQQAGLMSKMKKLKSFFSRLVAG